ncbi:gallate dioxygenase [Acidocella sp.]|uniref:gallate dioxygenase n=1 Tax=Acidocella sp. TaxID=50710 RepID=UPI003CFF57CE
MARIIGAIATSHTPTIGYALDTNKQNEVDWSPIFTAYEPLKTWLADKQPDAAIIIYNDHITSFFFDHYSPFALGIDELYHVADEGGGKRNLPPITGHAELSRHIAYSLSADDFDISLFRDKPLDHGCFSPISVLMPHAVHGWPLKIVPLQVGVLQFPLPSARRCYKLGQALRRAVESYPENLKVVIFATGGLSHQVHGERCGFNNTEWDSRFMDLIENDPEILADMTLAEYATLGGMEGAEVIMWLIMRGALSAKINCTSRNYYLPSMTGIATAIYENHADIQNDVSIARHYAKMTEQLAGIEVLPGTYPYDLERSAKGYRVNKFLHSLTNEDVRRDFLDNEADILAKADLTDEERRLVATRDWRGLIHHGAIFFVLEKLGAVSGISNLHIYAAMKNLALEEFLKTRNAPVLYSVSGK